MHRLYLNIYLTVAASLVLVVVIAAGLWHLGASPVTQQAFEMAGELAGGALPPAGEPPAVQQAALADLAHRLKIDLALFDQAGTRIAAVGRPLPPPDGDRGWIAAPGGPAWAFPLPDQRWIVVRAPLRHHNPAIGLILFLGGVAIAVGLGAFPFARGLTRRLERLQAGVETLGAGNLSTRVRVEGRDEIAALAGSFNRAATRIEELVGAHRMLLANASHELRTPLSRIRLGIELLEQTRDPKYKAAIERDIGELDAMVDEILLASRLEAIQRPQTEEDVDLLALAAEECARFERCSVEGDAVTVRGERRLLGRLIRNLLENATRHGAPPVHVQVRAAAGRAVLNVMDAGAGIPEDERERVFLPFHRLRGDAQGAGLGLALVRQIARLHGGDAVVAPRPDSASCFEVSLPST